MTNPHKTFKGAMTNYLKSDGQLLKEGLATIKGAIIHRNKSFANKKESGTNPDQGLAPLLLKLYFN